MAGRMECAAHKKSSSYTTFLASDLYSLIECLVTKFTSSAPKDSVHSPILNQVVGIVIMSSCKCTWVVGSTWRGALTAPYPSTRNVTDRAGSAAPPPPPHACRSPHFPAARELDRISSGTRRHPRCSKAPTPASAPAPSALTHPSTGTGTPRQPHAR